MEPSTKIDRLCNSGEYILDEPFYLVKAKDFIESEWLLNSFESHEDPKKPPTHQQFWHINHNFYALIWSLMTIKSVSCVIATNISAETIVLSAI